MFLLDHLEVNAKQYLMPSLKFWMNELRLDALFLTEVAQPSLLCSAVDKFKIKQRACVKLLPIESFIIICDNHCAFTRQKMNFSSPINVITVLFSDVHYRLSDISIWRLTSYFMENTLGTNQEIISLLFFFSSCVALSIFFFLDFNHFYFDLFRVLG